MNSFFLEPEFNKDFQNTLKCEVLSCYEKNQKHRSFWYQYNPKLLIPIACVLFVISFQLIFKKSNSDLTSLDLEISSISQELESDKDIVNAIDFTEEVVTY